MTKRLEIESQKRQATPYQMQLLRFKSPGLSRGQLLVKLSKLKNSKCPTYMSNNLVSLRQHCGHFTIDTIHVARFNNIHHIKQVFSYLLSEPTFSRSGRLIRKKTKGCDFVTP